MSSIYLPFQTVMSGDALVVEMSGSDLQPDPWGWDGVLTTVPGFGYFPAKVNTELDDMTKVNSSVFNNEISSKATINSSKKIHMNKKETKKKRTLMICRK